MKALVTGANGFIGRALCQHLTRLDYKVIPTVREPSLLPSEKVIAAGDHETLQKALKGCDSVLHLAGRAHVMREFASDPLKAFRESNVQLTRILAEQAARASVRRFVFVSSIKVNGDRTEHGKYFTAQDPPKPSDAYATSKWEAEQELQGIAKASNMEVVIVRPPLVYGPGVKGNFEQLLRWVRRGVPLPLGAVNNKRSLIALDNLISFLAVCADPDQTPKAADQILLVSDGVAVSTPQLLKKIAIAQARSIRLLPVPPALLRQCALAIGKGKMIDRLLDSLVVNDESSRRLVGWQPPVSMDEQLQKMVSNLKF